MNSHELDQTASIQSRLFEADLYASQGLGDEARSIYEQMLAQIGAQAHPLRAEIEVRLEKLAASEGNGSDNKEGDSSGADGEQDYSQRFSNASGLMEAGFHAEALNELKRILDVSQHPGVVRTKIGECYLCLDMPFEALEHLEEALRDQRLSKNERLDVLYRVSLTHERTGAVPLAIEALQQIVRLDPSFRNSAQRLEDLSKTAQQYGRFYYLVRENLLKEPQLERARELAKQGKKSLESILLTQFGIDKADLGYSLSEYYRCPFIEFDELEVGSTPSCIHGIKEHFFRTNTCVPIREKRGVLMVAVDNPHDLVKIDNIRRVLKAENFEFAIALKEDIDKFIDYFYGKYSVGRNEEDVFEQLELVEEESVEDEDEEGVVSDVDNVVVQMANKIIEDAYARQASDIHVESLTGKRGSRVRFRIDGDCMPYQTVPFNYKRALVSRIKIMSNLDIAEKRLPQDGKIKFKTRTGRTIELRVATLPTAEGNEDIVLRILASSDAMPLDRIGMLDYNLEQMKGLLEMPYGLVLAVGPTGSGKTTTLHAALGQINRPEKKIWTAEDPIEIVQEGLRQVQVKPGIGLTFARVLRAFLRADPDIIMIGETRDEETATTVIEASLTGHLVFSTLHTNSAPETVTRLLGMGMDPFNFADALLGVLAQRLVKRLCAKCKQPYRPDKEEAELILQEYRTHPCHPLELDAVASATLYRPKGCEHCNNSGYRGRLAVHELLTSGDELRRLVQQRSPVADIQREGMKSGMLTLKQDGIQKVLKGETDMKQVRAACIR